MLPCAWHADTIRAGIATLHITQEETVQKTKQHNRRYILAQPEAGGDVQDVEIWWKGSTGSIS